MMNENVWQGNGIPHKGIIFYNLAGRVLASTIGNKLSTGTYSPWRKQIHMECGVK
jgi:hypothetical protein